MSTNERFLGGIDSGKYIEIDESESHIRIKNV